MNYDFLDSSQYTCLVYPKLKNIPESTITSKTNTKHLVTHQKFNSRLRNPILSITIKKGFKCIWGYKSKLNSIKLTKKRGLVQCSDHKKIDLKSEILNINASNYYKDALILVLTEDCYLIVNHKLSVISKVSGTFLDVQLNPYYPTQIATLTDSLLQMPCQSESNFLCKGFIGFDFHFSPFVFNLYNNTSINLKDSRQPKLMPVYSTSPIFQVLPIDCCYNYSILTETVDLIDCRYWRPYKKYPHLTPGKNWRMFTYPLRTTMYSEGVIAETHQDLFCISDNIEKIPHLKEFTLNDIFLSLAPGCEDCGKLQPCISEFTELHAGTYALINEKKFWVQICKAGGFYIQSQNTDLNLSTISEKSRVLYKRKLKSAKKVNKLSFLESLLMTDIKAPISTKPTLPFTYDPVFEDFEDDN